VASKQFSILFKQGFIDKHKEGKDEYYEIREPLMRICFEINENPEGRAKLFVAFLKIIYDEVARKKNYLKYKLVKSYAGSQLKSTYRSVAEIYGLTLSTQEREKLKEIEAELKDCPYENLETEISRLFENEQDSSIIDKKKAILYFNSGNSNFDNKEFHKSISDFKKNYLQKTKMLTSI
jgi:hypothetical protein